MWMILTHTSVLCEQAFKPEIEKWLSKYVIRTAQLSNLQSKHMKNKTIFLESGYPQEAWTSIWLKACM